MKIAIINGPNLNLLGKREVDIYGAESFDTVLKNLQEKYADIELSYFHSNIEGELIDEIQRAGFHCDGIILNPGGYSHTSIAIGDAIAAVIAPVIEVHISNIFSREAFRTHSYVSAKAKGVISGMGLHVYELALEYFYKITLSNKA
jgi:3-dehydroquinate dehydratase II